MEVKFRDEYYYHALNAGDCFLKNCTPYMVINVAQSNDSQYSAINLLNGRTYTFAANDKVTYIKPTLVIGEYRDVQTSEVD